MTRAISHTPSPVRGPSKLKNNNLCLPCDLSPHPPLPNHYSLHHYHRAIVVDVERLALHAAALAAGAISISVAILCSFTVWLKSRLSFHAPVKLGSSDNVKKQLTAARHRLVLSPASLLFLFLPISLSLSLSFSLL